MKTLLVVACLLGSCWAQPAQPCKVTFAVVRKDDAGDLINGFRPKTLEWFQKKMAKKYPAVCYSDEPDSSEIVLFFSQTPAVYHGWRTYSSTSTSQSPITGTVTNGNVSSTTYGQQVGTISGTVDTTTTTTNTVPYEVDYNHLHLAIEYKFSSGWKPIEGFEGKTLHPTYYGICTRNCHPNNSMIEEAVKYLNAMKPKQEKPAQ